METNLPLHTADEPANTPRLIPTTQVETEAAATPRGVRAIRRSWLWAVLALTLGIICIVIAFVPQPITGGETFDYAPDTTPEPTATVFYELDRGWVLNAGGCATVSWRVSGIRELYFEGVGRIGEDSQVVCPMTATTYTLTVGFQDGTIRYYSIPIAIRSQTSDLWVLLLLTAFTAAIGLNSAYTRTMFDWGMRWDRLRAWASTHRLGVIAVVGVIAAVIIWWLPSGFRVGPLVDSWSLLVWIDDGARPFFFPDVAPTRPITYNPWIAALAISPESFIGLNIMLAAAHAAKGILMFRLLRRLVPDSFAFAWIGAVLFTVFPADHGIFYQGALNIQWAVALVLLAVNLLIDYWRHPSTGRLIAMLLAQAAAVGVYEAGIPLMLCAPLVLIWIERKIPRRWFGVTAIWTVIPAIWITYFISTLIVGSSGYQAGLLDVSEGQWSLPQGLGFTLFANFIMGFGFGADAGRRSVSGEAPIWFLIAAVVIAVGAVAMVGIAARFSKSNAQTSDQKTPSRRGRWFFLLVAGFIATIVGFAIYIPTRDFSAQQYTWRLWMFTPIGASVAITAALMLLPRRVMLATAGILIGLAALRGIDQHDRFRKQATAQQRIVHDVIEQAPGVSDYTVMVLMDASGRDATRVMTLNYVFEHSTQLIYGNRMIMARLCYDDGVNGFDHERCTFGDGALTVPAVWGGFEQIPYHQLILYQYTPDDQIILLDTIPESYLNGADASTYDPRARIDPRAPLPTRLETMFEYRDTLDASLN